MSGDVVDNPASGEHQESKDCPLAALKLDNYLSRTRISGQPKPNTHAYTVPGNILDQWKRRRLIGKYSQDVPCLLNKEKELDKTLLKKISKGKKGRLWQIVLDPQQSH